MKLLLDTDLLLWAAGPPEQLLQVARGLPKDFWNLLILSAVSFREIPTKHRLDRADYQTNAWVLRRGLLDNGYEKYRTRDIPRADVFNYVGKFFNPKRCHLTIGYVDPVLFKKLLCGKKVCPSNRGGEPARRGISAV